MYTPSGSVYYLFLIIIYIVAELMHSWKESEKQTAPYLQQKNFFFLHNNGVSQIDIKSKQHGFRCRLNSA